MNPKEPWLDACAPDEAPEDVTTKAKRIAKNAGGTKAQVEGKGPSQATQLVGMALEHYDVLRDTAGTPFARLKDGPNVVRPLRGGDDSLRAELARAYFGKHQSAASSGALADAMTTLTGFALEADPVPVHLRVAYIDDVVWLDIGDVTGRVIRIDRDGWNVHEQSPVLFRRTELTSVLPEPQRGGSIEPLWNTVNVPVEDRPIVLAVEIASLLPGIAHPITLLLAEHGSGKTTAARRLGGVLDPSFPPVRKPPKDEESWVTAASGSQVTVIDNVSTIPDWWSDALCRASTGDGDVRRKLYTDDALTVFSFRRVVWLTTIALPALRDDLADRVVHIDLRSLDGTNRRRDEELDREWNQQHPVILGALLDLASRVLAILAEIVDQDMPRMADFHRVLLAVDAVLGTEGSQRYRRKSDELAVDTAASDPLIVALTKVLADAVPEPRTAAKLLQMVDADRWDLESRPKGWPRTAKELSNALTRHAPTLRRLGWTITKHDRGGKLRSLQWTIAAPAGSGFDD
jgi:hypothetical protein